MTTVKIPWVFDVISPFAYLEFHQMRQAPPDIEFQPVPVLFAGLLNHYGQIGNAEIESKRRFTYRFALWRAQQMGIDMRFPPAHPFNPLMALRLIIAAGTTYKAVQTILDAVFLHGRDVADASVIADLAAQLNVVDPNGALSAPAVKQQLHDNTAWAISKGVFGVPTIVIDRELFWGHDAFDMALDYLRAPKRFQTAEMRALDTLPVGVLRPRKPVA
jgi:2-hydroxychromene-2-carboxylate isomerase